MKNKILKQVNDSIGEIDFLKITENKIQFNEVGINNDNELNINVINTSETSDAEIINDSISINLKNSNKLIDLEKIVAENEDIIVEKISKLMTGCIIREMVSKIYKYAELNRASAPIYGINNAGSIVNQTVFDLDTNLAANAAAGGATTHAIQRKLVTKMVFASNYIATEGHEGPAEFAITNGALAASLMDIAGYTNNPIISKNNSGQLCPVGQIGDMQIYVDTYMKYFNKLYNK